MSSNDFSKLVGTHAPFSPSNPSWINYDSTDKVIEAYRRSKSSEIGTKLHSIAERRIRLGMNVSDEAQLRDLVIFEIGYFNFGCLGDHVIPTMTNYINDAIGYRMDPEQVVYYSDNFYGTADALKYRNKLLRIHDLKTGVTPANMNQLLIYAALWCLMKKKKPGDINMELRIYQNNEAVIFTPDASDVLPVMDKIVTFDKVITKVRQEEGM